MDKRTVVLADDGRFVTLGRHTQPSDEEIARVVAALTAQGIGGWLATMDGSAYAARCPALALVRELAPPRASWDDAVKAFRAGHDARGVD